MSKESKPIFGKYRIAEVGDIILTDDGLAQVSDVTPYQEILDDMNCGLISAKEIATFKRRIAIFLKDPQNYFQITVTYRNGEPEDIDWPEYLIFYHRQQRQLRIAERLAQLSQWEEKHA